MHQSKYTTLLCCSSREVLTGWIWFLEDLSHNPLLFLFFRPPFPERNNADFRLIWPTRYDRPWFMHLLEPTFPVFCNSPPRSHPYSSISLNSGPSTFYCWSGNGHFCLDHKGDLFNFFFLLKSLSVPPRFSVRECFFAPVLHWAKYKFSHNQIAVFFWNGPSLPPSPPITFLIGFFISATPLRSTLHRVRFPSFYPPWTHPWGCLRFACFLSFCPFDPPPSWSLCLY